MFNADVREISVTPNLANFGVGAYSSGDCVGGLLTFSGALSGPTKTGRVRSVKVTDLDKQNAALTLLLFSANPTASTLTDNAVVVIATADQTKLLPYVAVLATDYQTFSTSSLATVSSLLSGVWSATLGSGSGILYGVLMTTGTPTYTGASKLVVTLDIESD